MCNSSNGAPIYLGLRVTHVECLVTRADVWQLKHCRFESGTPTNFNAPLWYSPERVENLIIST